MARQKAIKVTKQGFEALAEAIRPVEPLAERIKLVQRILPALYAGNPKFSAVLFVKACNVASLIWTDGIGSTERENDGNTATAHEEN